jgi:hypothetical protein
MKIARDSLNCKMKNVVVFSSIYTPALVFIFSLEREKERKRKKHDYIVNWIIVNSPKSTSDKARAGSVCIMTAISFADVEQTRWTRKTCVEYTRIV